MTDGQENPKNPGVDGHHRTTEIPCHQCSQWPSSAIELHESVIASLPCPVWSLPVLLRMGKQEHLELECVGENQFSLEEAEQLLTCEPSLDYYLSSSHLGH